MRCLLQFVTLTFYACYCVCLFCFCFVLVLFYLFCFVLRLSLYLAKLCFVSTFFLFLRYVGIKRAFLSSTLVFVCLFVRLFVCCFSFSVSHVSFSILQCNFLLFCFVIVIVNWWLFCLYVAFSLCIVVVTVDIVVVVVSFFATFNSCLIHIR